MDSTEEGGVDVSDCHIEFNQVNKKSYVLALDIGTTVIRAYVYDKNVAVLGSSHTKVRLLFYKFSFLQKKNPPFLMKVL